MALKSQNPHKKIRHLNSKDNHPQQITIKKHLV